MEQLKQAIAKQRAKAIVQEQPEPEEVKAGLEKERRALDQLQQFIAKQRARAALEELRRAAESFADAQQRLDAEERTTVELAKELEELRQLLERLESHVR